MVTAADPLPDDLETAHQLIRELLETLGQQIHLNAKLQHQLEQLLRHRYGRKSERVDPAQLLLFAQQFPSWGFPFARPLVFISSFVNPSSTMPPWTPYLVIRAQGV